jgi:hypothetical protein
MKNQKQAIALGCLVGALFLGALFQHIADQEAAVLGLSALELAMLGFVAGSVVNRQLS